MLKKAWYLGNTTVRNPRRLRLGLEVYSKSDLHGNLIGTQNEQKFAVLLHEKGVVFINRFEDSIDSNVSDLGRKWRAALMQLGFITHKDSANPFVITNNGKRLISTSTLPQENECFLRALLVQQLPSQIEAFPVDHTFSPLHVVLEVLKGLENYGEEAYIHIDEMASIVQRAGMEDVDEAVRLIIQYRIDKENAENKWRFKNEYQEKASAHCDRQSAGTLHDYADSNSRYLRLTGLFNENARRLSVAPYKKVLVDQILAKEYIPIKPEQYLNELWQGASLPTDNSLQAIQDIDMLIQVLKENGVNKEYSNLYKMTPEDLSQLRLSLEDDLFKSFEKKYAAQQKDECMDITNYLRSLTNPGKKFSQAGSAAKDLSASIKGPMKLTPTVPKGEAPAYLEWAVWRAFLAISSLVNEPWDARRFRVDENFYPITTAPGGGPDIIFEYRDFVLVVEVTLTTSSRQEAAEGEPVRRHVAQYIEDYEKKGKRVYGLFVANNIDTNTAETFRIGSWFRNDDSKIAVQIVPLTITQFTSIFEKIMSEDEHVAASKILEIIRYCLSESNNEAPKWKLRISEEVQKFCS